MITILNYILVILRYWSSLLSISRKSRDAIAEQYAEIIMRGKLVDEIQECSATGAARGSVTGFFDSGHFRNAIKILRYYFR